ncbi:uncharacterized protein LOC131251086 isoform X1 [Magnolia sinica]|uniref:uncharacterized protein LOC131251086 isoform X1 n=1 Tax=Magnolia sinica TaxID=86752 RepID=UPI00265A06F8|nr:uncharacterized protein LOC131251086 isoform X1 [Magnolia sinica]
MGFLKGSLPVCLRSQHCAEWARIYMKYCLCGVKDRFSFTLGLVSVFSWGVAEVPQIITNYKKKSTEGISIVFLMTWIVGDLFNLFGCMLEPATLPTQYYMAMLYTATTVILAAQTTYYGHIYHRPKANKIGSPCKGSKHHQSGIVTKNEPNGSSADDFKAQDNTTNGSNIAVEGLHPPSSPIPVAATVLPRYGSLGRDLYYMSARSLTKSRTPTMRSYLAHAHDHTRTCPIAINNQNSTEEPLLGGPVSMQSAPPLNTKSMLCVFSAMMFFLSSFNLNLSVNNGFNAFIRKPPEGVIIRVGRKLLQSNSGPSINLRRGSGSSGIGTFLGWAMAAIYMGGRLPQICLNVRDYINYSKYSITHPVTHAKAVAIYIKCSKTLGLGGSLNAHAPLYMCMYPWTHVAT